MVTSNQRTSAFTASLPGKLLAGVSAIAFSVAAWSTPSVAAQSTARCYVDVGPNTSGPLLSNRAFVQFAGQTAGITESFYDFYSVPAAGYRGQCPDTEIGDTGWILYVPPPITDIWSVTLTVGGVSNTTLTKTLFGGSSGSSDTLTMPNAPASPTANNWVIGGGIDIPLGGFADIGSANTGGANPTGRHAPKYVQPAPLIPFGVEANVYFFPGSNSTINGIPGGPGVTSTGDDNFNIKDKFLFTAGGWVAVPIYPGWRFAVTGGFAEAEKSMTYNCVTYCLLGMPATPTFSDSKDVWLPGGYVGGRIETSLGIAAWPGATMSFDYKHVFLGSENVTFGNIATRTVTLNTSGDIDMFMARLTLPLRMR
jgi:hypothetical protein